MVEIDDVKDRDSFKAWLDALPKDTEEEKCALRDNAVVLAMRSGMRTLPSFWEWTVKNEEVRSADLTALPVLRSFLVSLVASAVSSDEIRAAAFNAADAAAIHAVKATNVVAAATYNAAYNAAAATYGSMERATEAAVFNAEDAAAAINIGIWQEISIDCRFFLHGRKLLHRPLWTHSQAASDQLWSDVKLRILEQQDHWRFWIHWYDSVHVGTPMPLKLLTEIALLEPKLWQQGASVVNPIVNKMWDDFEQFGPDESDNGTDHALLNETPFQTLSKNARIVSMQLDVLIKFLHQQIDQLVGNNRLTDTVARDQRILQLRAILDKIQEIADAFPEGEVPENNALELIEENLPAVVEQAYNLPAIIGEPDVSERIHTLAAGVKVLSDAGMTGDSAAKYVAAEMGSKSLGNAISGWWRNRKSS